MRESVAAALLCLSLACLANAQTPAAVRLYNCRGEIDMNEMIFASDLNRGYPKYQVEFAIAGDWNNATVIELDQDSRKVFSDFPQLKFDTPYVVRFSVKQAGGSWSAPGAESCPFRLKNFVRLLSCAPEIPMIDMIMGSDLNRTGGRYKVEFARNGNWNDVTIVELDTDSRMTYSRFPRLQYDTPYVARISVKQKADAKQTVAEKPWSLPGPNSCVFQLKNVLKLYSCGPAVPLADMILATDFNQGAGAYRVEFAKNGDWKNAVVIELANASRKTYRDFPQIRYDTPYTVRFSVKMDDLAQNLANQPWSLPGPVCSMRTAPCPTPLQVTARSTSSVCNSSGSASAAVTGGIQPYAYAWTPNGATASTAADLASGVHTVTVTDVRGCKGTAQVTIATTDTPLALCISTTDATCAGGSNGVASVSPSGGKPPYIYAWSTTPPQATASAASLAEGIYEVTVTDANGCARRARAVVARQSCTP